MFPWIDTSFPVSFFPGMGATEHEVLKTRWHSAASWAVGRSEREEAFSRRRTIARGEFR